MRSCCRRVEKLCSKSFFGLFVHFFSPLVDLMDSHCCVPKMAFTNFFFYISAPVIITRTSLVSFFFSQVLYFLDVRHSVCRSSGFSDELQIRIRPLLTVDKVRRWSNICQYDCGCSVNDEYIKSDPICSKYHHCIPRSMTCTSSAARQPSSIFTAHICDHRACVYCRRGSP